MVAAGARALPITRPGGYFSGENECFAEQSVGADTAYNIPGQYRLRSYFTAPGSFSLFRAKMSASRRRRRPPTPLTQTKETSHVTIVHPPPPLQSFFRMSGANSPLGQSCYMTSRERRKIEVYFGSIPKQAMDDNMYSSTAVPGTAAE